MARLKLKSDKGYKQHMTSRGHVLLGDEPEAMGGTNTGPAPYEFILAGLASCTSITLRMYADHKGFDIGEIGMVCDFGRDYDGAEHIDRKVTVTGALTAAQKARLLEICGRTPVTKSLLKSFRIDTTLDAPVLAE